MPRKAVKTRRSKALRKRRPLDRDPRTARQRAADASALLAFERGELLAVPRKKLADAVVSARERSHILAEVRMAAGELGRLRRQWGITQEQLARAIGSHKTDISRAESGRHAPSLRRLLLTVRAIEQLSGAEVAGSEAARFDPLLERLYAAFETPQTCLRSVAMEAELP